MGPDIIRRRQAERNDMILHFMELLPLCLPRLIEGHPDIQTEPIMQPTGPTWQPRCLLGAWQPAGTLIRCDTHSARVRLLAAQH